MSQQDPNGQQQPAAQPQYGEYGQAPQAPQAPQQPAYGQQPYAQAPEQPYGYQPYPSHYPVEPPTNVLAIVSLIAAFLMPVVGAVLGFVAISQIKKTGEKGLGLAQAGAWVGVGLTAISILAIIGYFVMIALLIGANVATTSNY